MLHLISISPSERYPLVSQLIESDKIPEFDNLHLDFNGIIHQCSHSNDIDAHFRMTEEQIFKLVFLYVDHLFAKIRPKKLFFIAVDGVAPRAKMNQQRSRRFRAVKEAQKRRERAERYRDQLPDEKGFDSNSVTPGTQFMDTLSERLKFYINKKITEDANWRNVEVILSGPDVPGEGEHKIMEYIRFARSQPGYDPNTRHCLYGLDADLIMLGLLSHEPHFCLLREEVKFGHAYKKKYTSFDSMNFYLLHLSLMREYLDIDFRSLAPSLSFTYSLENVIDDFILLAVFVGNDFLPDLPGFHIRNNGLERLFDMYKIVLPKLDGYINQNGDISLQRLQVLLNEMAKLDQKAFEKEYAYLKAFNAKKSASSTELGTSSLVVSYNIPLTSPASALTKAQRNIFDQVIAYVTSNEDGPQTTLRVLDNLTSLERPFFDGLADDLNLVVRWDESDEDDNKIIIWIPRKVSEYDSIESFDGEEEVSTDDDRSAVDSTKDHDVILRALRKCTDALTIDEGAFRHFDDGYDDLVKEKLDEWKKKYYGGKLKIKLDEVDQVVYRYIEGLQWVIKYYYGGVPSWSWFYDYHYAPRISDLRDVDKMTFSFELGRPFKPFEQLMAVLPPASRQLVPEAYRDLMTNPTSPILDFYPTSFHQDFDGVTREWEAVVKIPFINEQRLLSAMSKRQHRLTPEERERNSFARTTKLTHSFVASIVYKSPIPGIPDIHRCHCQTTDLNLKSTTETNLPIPGLCDGVLLGAKAPAGFPSLETLPHAASLGFNHLNVHGSDSTLKRSPNKSVLVTIHNQFERRTTREIAEDLIGERIFVRWPFLWEGLVAAVSDSSYRYECARVKTGPIDVMLHVRPLRGVRRLENRAVEKEFEEENKTIDCAVQMCLKKVISEDPRYIEAGPSYLTDFLPEDSQVVFLGAHYYGSIARVTAAANSTLSIVVEHRPSDKSGDERLKGPLRSLGQTRWTPSWKAANLLRITPRALSRITSSFTISIGQEQKTNIGLDMKFEAKAFKVLEYTQKPARHWEYSEKAIELVKDYKVTFPEIFERLDHDNDIIVSVTDVFQSLEPQRRLQDVRNWLKERGIRDFEPVPLLYDQLPRVRSLLLDHIFSTYKKLLQTKIVELEQLINFEGHPFSSRAPKELSFQDIPPQAIIVPCDSAHRLQDQQFALGDRVRMVKDSGPVPFSAKGVVIGLDKISMDVLWDEPFFLGTTLDGRCSEHRGMTVDIATCLNLTNPQLMTFNILPSIPSRFACRNSNNAACASPIPSNSELPKTGTRFQLPEAR
ncbi:5'-3' exoribonuclease 1 [Leucoagaricus sp. SymC.cos]|nr:5'-3' exoribonuclease 1 [Leucoagaricus sp. SymC.cos]